MAPKKKKPTFSGSNTRATPAILSQPAPSLASTQSSSPSPQPAPQSDYKLVDFWIKTQPVPESVLKSWENIEKNFFPTEVQSSSTGLTNRIFQKLENINKQLDKQEAKPSYAQAVQKSIPAQISLPARILKEVLVHPGIQPPDMANRTHIQLFQALQDRLPSPYNKQVRAVRKLSSGESLLTQKAKRLKSS